MLRSLDTYDSRSPDSSTRNAWSLNSELARITFGAALEAFLTARAAEGASPATITWYRMVLGRAARGGTKMRPAGDRCSFRRGGGPS